MWWWWWWNTFWTPSWYGLHDQYLLKENPPRDPLIHSHHQKYMVLSCECEAARLPKEERPTLLPHLRWA
jgi:hypothetical protein